MRNLFGGREGFKALWEDQQVREMGKARANAAAKRDAKQAGGVTHNPVELTNVDVEAAALEAVIEDFFVGNISRRTCLYRRICPYI